MLRKTYFWMALVLAIGSVAIAKNSNAKVFSNPQKLVDAQSMVGKFESGEDKIKVVITLAEPAEIKGKTDWKSFQSRAERRSKIANLQNPVLSSMLPSEFKLRHRFQNLAGFSAEVTADGLNKLLNDPTVESVEPVIILYPHLRQGIPLMNASVARNSFNGQGIAIAITDTGIDYTHPMLGGGGFPNSKVIGGYDFGDNDPDPKPVGDEAHGTACAGIAAGNVGNVGDYVGGVAYNAKLYALKITPGSSGSASSDDMAAAWDWCVTHQNDNPSYPDHGYKHQLWGR